MGQTFRTRRGVALSSTSRNSDFGDRKNLFAPAATRRRHGRRVGAGRADCEAPTPLSILAMFPPVYGWLATSVEPDFGSFPIAVAFLRFNHVRFYEQLAYYERIVSNHEQWRPKMKWNIDDVPVFHAVVETGGVTSAASLLKMPKSSVSKAISRLEERLGVRLLDRNSRQVRPTPEGQAFFRQCRRILEQVAETDAIMTGMAMTPTGRLTVALPPAFCQEILAPHLLEFHQLFPLVELELVVTTQPVDILGDQFDLAIVVGVQSDSELIQKPLLGPSLIWITSPAYVERIDSHAEASVLAGHVMICERRYADRPLLVKQHGHAVRLEIAPKTIRVNNPLIVRQAVAQGAGLSFLPDCYCRELIKDGRLVEVGCDANFETSASTLTAVYPGRRLVSARICVFLNFLEKICAEFAKGARSR